MSEAASEVTVDRCGAGRTVAVHVGDVIVVQLEENLTAGYAWEPVTLPPWCRVQAFEHEHPANARRGGAGRRRLRIMVTGPGSGAMEFQLRRPRDTPNKAADRFAFSVCSD